MLQYQSETYQMTCFNKRRKVKGFVKRVVRKVVVQKRNATRFVSFGGEIFMWDQSKGLTDVSAGGAVNNEISKTVLEWRGQSAGQSKFRVMRQSKKLRVGSLVIFRVTVTSLVIGIVLFRKVCGCKSA